MASSLPTMEKAIAAAVVDNETFEAAVRAVDVLDSSSRFGGATTSLASDEAEGGHQENPLNSRALVLESECTTDHRPPTTTPCTSVTSITISISIT